MRNAIIDRVRASLLANVRRCELNRCKRAFAILARLRVVLGLLFVLATLPGCYMQDREVVTRDGARTVMVSETTVSTLAQRYGIDVPPGYVVDSVWGSQANVVWRCHLPSAHETHAFLIAVTDGAIAFADARRTDGP